MRRRASGTAAPGATAGSKTTSSRHVLGAVENGQTDYAPTPSSNGARSGEGALFSPETQAMHAALDALAAAHQSSTVGAQEPRGGMDAPTPVSNPPPTAEQHALLSPETQAMHAALDALATARETGTVDGRQAAISPVAEASATPTRGRGISAHSTPTSLKPQSKTCGSSLKRPRPTSPAAAPLGSPSSLEQTLAPLGDEGAEADCAMAESASQDAEEVDALLNMPDWLSAAQIHLHDAPSEGVSDAGSDATTSSAGASADEADEAVKGESPEAADGDVVVPAWLFPPGEAPSPVRAIKPSDGRDDGATTSAAPSDGVHTASEARALLSNGAAQMLGLPATPGPPASMCEVPRSGEMAIVAFLRRPVPSAIRPLQPCFGVDGVVRYLVSSSDGVTFAVARRYREWRALLLALPKEVRAKLPPFPPKTFTCPLLCTLAVAPFDAALIEHRTAMLQAWAVALLSLQAARHLKAVQVFFLDL